MCRIMSNQCMMYPSNYLMCETCVRFVSNLVTWGICYLSPVFILHLLIFLELLTSLLAYFLVLYSV